MTPDRAHTLTFDPASGATTRIFDSATIRLSIFDSATAPAPTTKHSRLFNFRKIGNRLMSALHQVRHAARCGIALGNRHKLPSQVFAQLNVAMSRKEFTQVFARRTLVKVMTQQALYCVRNFTRQASVADRA